jgi:release factor glutamine methyltransferase
MYLCDVRPPLVERLAAAGIASPEAEAIRLLEAVTGLTPSAQAIAAARRRLTQVEQRSLEGWTRRRETREPLQHILGVAPFYGLELIATPDALIPRPETERLVELALESLADAPAPRILDVGTGGGAIALALKRERPGAEVRGSDLSARALTLARRNAERFDLAVRFDRSDLLADPEVAAFARRVDLIVANPPYLPDGDRVGIDPEVGFDPPEALYAGADGLELFRRLQRESHAVLPSGARLIVELDPRNIDAAAALARTWADREVLEDLAGRRRFLRLVRS